MNILSLFVLIPALMLLGLWIARNLNQVRGVMVAGSSMLLALSIWLCYYFVTERNAGNDAEMLLVASTPWFKPLNIAYSVGVEHHRVHWYLRLMAAEAHDQGVFPLVHPPFYRCIWILHLHRHVYHVHVL